MSLTGMVFTVAVMSMFGCGGGGDSTPPPPTKAALKLFSQYSSVGTKISSIAVTVVLPSGVTVKATASPDNNAILVTDAGVVVPSGKTTAATFDPQVNPTGVYTPATATTLGTVMVLLPAQTDFDLGEYVTINTDIAAGSFPTASDFTLKDFTAVDLNGKGITGVTSTIVPTFN